MIEKQKIKILDCTLRDGGYYNNWDFYQDLVEAYLDAMDQASVYIVEIGFRSPPNRSFMGTYFYQLDDYLEKIPLPKKAQIGVMIKGHLAGTAIDVFEQEPYNGALTELERCHLTSHMGSMSIDCHTHMEVEATQEVVLLIKGQPLEGVVPEVEYEAQQT